MKNDFYIMEDHVIIVYKNRKGEMSEILVDYEDFLWIKKHTWHVANDGYAARKIIDNGKPRRILMHREINKTPEEMQTDHINCNRVDNRRCNLRSCTHKNNHANKSKQKRKCSSRFKGVHWDANFRKWCAGITVNRELIHIGHFVKEEVAAFAYNIYAKKYYGEFARLNKINFNY